MDIGRDVITKAIASTEAESVFQPWWVTVQHYMVYTLLALGLIALPVNCMLGNLGNCSYDYSHPENYALPFNICRIEGNQLVLEKQHVSNKTIRDINETQEITQAFLHGNFILLNMTEIPEIFHRILEDDEYLRKNLKRNSAGCYVKEAPNHFPFHVYWNSVNQLSWLVLYLPYLIFCLALSMILLERLLTRFFWTGQRIEKFYNLLVKQSIKEGVNCSTLYTRENRLACQQILYDFRDSSIHYRAYMCQTLGKLLIAAAVVAWSFASPLRVRQSFKSNFNSRMQGYMHQCTIPANDLNEKIFELVNGLMMLILISSFGTLVWYVRIYMPDHCYGMVANTKLSRLLNKCQQDMKPFPSTINSIYFKSTDMRLLLNILTETKGLWASLRILSLFDSSFRQIFKPQLEKVSSTVPARGRKNINLKWREPYGALLASLSLDQGQMMYVSEVDPPGETDDFYMFPACDALSCEYRLDSEENNNHPSKDIDDKSMISGYGSDSNFESESSSSNSSPKSSISNGSHKNSFSSSSSKSSFSSSSSHKDPDADIHVVESLHSGKDRKTMIERLLCSEESNSNGSATSPYNAVFKNLKTGTDYKISISFLLAGNCLGVANFTVAADSRKTSSSSSSSSSESRKVSDISCITSDTSLTAELMEIEEEEDDEYDEDDIVQKISSHSRLEDIIAENGERQVIVLMIGTSWCQVCTKMKPKLDSIAKDMKEVIFLSVDFEKVPAIKDDYPIAAFPTLFILVGGNVMDKIIGDQSQLLMKKLELYTRMGIPATGTGQPTGNITAVGQQPDDQLVRPNIRGAQQGRSENGRMRKRMEEFCILISGGKK